MTELRYKVTNSFPKLPEKYIQFVKTLLQDKNRRYFGSAASGLANQLNDPKYKEFNINTKAINAGIKGEEDTSKVLRKWIKDKPNAILVDSIHLPIGGEADDAELDEEEGQVNSLGDTDHLVIIGDNLIIIDSKNWKKKAGYSVTEKGEVLRAKKSFPGNRPHASQSKYLWKKFYSGVDVHVESYVCIANEESPVERGQSWWHSPFKLVNQEHLIYFLDREYERTYKHIDYIHVDVVAQAIQGIQKPYNKFQAAFPTFYKLTNTK